MKWDKPKALDIAKTIVLIRTLKTIENNKISSKQIKKNPLEKMKKTSSE